MKNYFRKTNKYPSNIVKPEDGIEDPLKYLIGSSNLDKICSVLCKFAWPSDWVKNVKKELIVFQTFSACSVKYVEEKLDEDPNVVIYIK